METVNSGLFFSNSKFLSFKYPKTIFTIGGGGKNLKWNEIRKKILGVKLNKPLSNDASFGSALLALGNIFKW